MEKTMSKEPIPIRYRCIVIGDISRYFRYIDRLYCVQLEFVLHSWL